MTSDVRSELTQQHGQQGLRDILEIDTRTEDVALRRAIGSPQIGKWEAAADIDVFERTELALHVEKQLGEAFDGQLIRGGLHDLGADVRMEPGDRHGVARTAHHVKGERQLAAPNAEFGPLRTGAVSRRGRAVHAGNHPQGDIGPRPQGTRHLDDAGELEQAVRIDGLDRRRQRRAQLIHRLGHAVADDTVGGKAGQLGAKQLARRIDLDAKTLGMEHPQHLDRGKRFARIADPRSRMPGCE